MIFFFLILVSIFCCDFIAVAASAVAGAVCYLCSCCCSGCALQSSLFGGCCVGVLGCVAWVLGWFFEEKMVCFPRCHFWGGKSLKTPMVLNRFFFVFFCFRFR